MRHKSYSQFVEELVPWTSFDDVVKNIPGASWIAYQRDDGKYGAWGQDTPSGSDSVGMWFNTEDKAKAAFDLAKRLGYKVEKTVDHDFMNAPHLAKGRLGREEPYYRVVIRKS